MFYIFGFVVIVIVLISYKINQKEKVEIDKIFKDIVTERGGDIKRVFGYYSQLIVPYRDTDIMLSAMTSGSTGNGGRPPQTFAQFHTSHSSDNIFFQISSLSTESIIQKALGFKDINIDDTLFDKQFFIQGKDEKFIKRLLTKDIKKSIMSLNSEHGMKVSFAIVKFFDGSEWVEKPRLDITLYKLSTTSQDYSDLLEIAILFYDEIEKL